MNTRPTIALIAAFVSVLGAAQAGAGTAPGTPPPATGFQTPLTGDRDTYPSASVATGGGACRGVSGGTVIMNGALVPMPSAEVSGMVSATAPMIINGGPVPSRTVVSNDPSWCAGAYAPELGTNFAGQ